MQQQENKKLTGAQRVAVVLLSLPEEETLKIFANLSEDEIKEVSYAMSNLGLVGQSAIQAVMSEFNSEMANNSVFLGNLTTTEKILSKFLDKEQLRGIMEDIRGPQGKSTWEKLSNVNEEVLASYLINEHPQIAAIILSKTPTDQTAKVLRHLPDHFAFDIMSRMLNITSIKSEMLDGVEKVLKSEFISIVGKTQKQDSFNMIASILNNLDQGTETKYMNMLENAFPEAATKIKNLMFTFNDLVRLDGRGIQSVIRAIDKSLLPLALKGAPEEIRDLFLSNMSQRQARLIKEELEGLGKVRLKDVHNAQAQIVLRTKELIAKGEVDISDSKDNEYI